MTYGGSQRALPTPAAAGGLALWRLLSRQRCDHRPPGACSSSTRQTNPAIVQAAPTVTVNPRRGSQDKAPWKDLDLTAITGQTVENRHLFDIHLGETIAPYVTLEPLKALLPLKRGDAALPRRRRRPRRHPAGRAGTADAAALADDQPPVGGQQSTGQSA